MDTRRAEEILQSPETVKISYRGRPVWIESINGGRGTARVSTGTGSLTVEISDLVENSYTE